MLKSSVSLSASSDASLMPGGDEGGKAAECKEHAGAKWTDVADLPCDTTTTC
jgi:hypothetical protein